MPIFAGLVAGERVLVHGGAGGVGVYAVQLAALLGGQVTATGRDRDAEFILRLGATEFVSAAAAAVLPKFDVVIDTVGGAILAGSYGLLRPGGRLVTLSSPPDTERARAADVHAMFFVVTPDPGELAYLAELTAGRPVVSQTFPLAEGRAAFRQRQPAPATRQDGPDRPPPEN